MNIYTEARVIAAHIREVLHHDTNAPTVLSQDLGDILREQLDWVPANDTGVARLRNEIEELEHQIEQLRYDNADLKQQLHAASE